MTRPGTRSFLFLSVVVATWAPAAAQAQGEFLYKRDYTFERLEASRVVNDADDAGTIRLVTQVWHPVKNDQHKVVFFSHGSTGALALSPLEFGGDGSARQWLQFFIERGYTIVWPFRRGRGLSTGKYIEECATLVGECTPAQQLALTDRGLASALEDNYAVIDQLVIGKMVPKDAKLLLAGQSRGGYLSLIMAGERPGQVQGAVNFAGAWQSMQERLSPADIQHRLDVQGGPLARAARKSTRAHPLDLRGPRPELHRAGTAGAVPDLARSRRQGRFPLHRGTQPSERTPRAGSRRALVRGARGLPQEARVIRPQGANRARREGVDRSGREGSSVGIRTYSRTSGGTVAITATAVVGAGRGSSTSPIM